MEDDHLGALVVEIPFKEDAIEFIELGRSDMNHFLRGVRHGVQGSQLLVGDFFRFAGENPHTTLVGGVKPAAVPLCAFFDRWMSVVRTPDSRLPHNLKYFLRQGDYDCDDPERYHAFIRTGQICTVN